jgi:hypothetical protein
MPLLLLISWSMHIEDLFIAVGILNQPHALWLIQVLSHHTLPRTVAFVPFNLDIH